LKLQFGFALLAGVGVELKLGEATPLGNIEAEIADFKCCDETFRD
jgi:hypothetical protein